MQSLLNEKPTFYYMQSISQLHALSGHTPSESMQRHPALIVITEGTATFYMNGRNYCLKAGNIAHFQQGERLICIESSELGGYWISYDAVDSTICHSAAFEDGLLLSQASLRLMQLIEQSFKAWHTHMTTNPFAIQQLFSNMLFQLHNELQLQQHKKDYWLPDIISYIEQHYRTDITRSELAKLANVTPEHFSRVFHKETGHTYSAYLHLLRIRKAQQMMLTATPQLSQLAAMLGYEESSYFSRKFKQITGISPAAYMCKEKRIVSLTYNYTGCLRALDIVPEIATYSAWQEKSLQTSPQHKLLLSDADYEAIVETVTAIKPDVVLSYSALPINSHLLSVAPVIEIPFRQLSWKEQFLLIGNIVNRRQEAEEWLHAFQLRSMNFKAMLEHKLAPNRSIIVWEFGRQYAYCFAPSYGRACQFLYDELGFTMPEDIQQQNIYEKGFIEIEINQLSAFNADVILFVNHPQQPQMQNQFKFVLQSAKWQALKAVQHNCVYFLDEPELFYGFDPLSSLAQLQTLQNALTS